MKKFLFIVLCLALLGCSSLKVTYDYDRSADFSNYKTYSFSEETMDMGLNQLNRDRVLKAVENELNAKGFHQSNDPDAIVDVHIKGKQVTTANATTTGGMYGRYGWGMGMSTTSVTYDTYTEGTMLITLIDMETKNILWQGAGTKPLDENASPVKREQNINYVVGQIMAKYPPPTGK